MYLGQPATGYYDDTVFGREKEKKGIPPCGLYVMVDGMVVRSIGAVYLYEKDWEWY